VSLWLAYTGARLSAGTDLEAAYVHGDWMLDADRVMGFDWLDDANRWTTDNGLVALPLCYCYATLHYVATVLVLVWMWRRHPIGYPRAVAWLTVMSAVGLVFYQFLPTAPPRFLDGEGFVDTMSAWADWGWWSESTGPATGSNRITNEVAAFPSLHVGWAIWCAGVAYRYARRLWVRLLGWGYPTLITVTVVLTGNHYLIDALAGAALALLAWLAVEYVANSWRWAQSGRRPRQLVVDRESPPSTRSLVAERPPANEAEDAMATGDLIGDR